MRAAPVPIASGDRVPHEGQSLGAPPGARGGPREGRRLRPAEDTRAEATSHQPPRPAGPRVTRPGPPSLRDRWRPLETTRDMGAGPLGEEPRPRRPPAPRRPHFPASTATGSAGATGHTTSAPLTLPSSRSPAGARGSLRGRPAPLPPPPPPPPERARPTQRSRVPAASTAAATAAPTRPRPGHSPGPLPALSRRSHPHPLPLGLPDRWYCPSVTPASRPIRGLTPRGPAHALRWAGLPAPLGTAPLNPFSPGPAAASLLSCSCLPPARLQKVASGFSGFLFPGFPRQAMDCKVGALRSSSVRGKQCPSSSCPCRLPALLPA